VVILLPLSMIKDMSGFRHVSFASLISLFYLGIVLLIELPSYAQQNYTPQGNIIAWWDWNLPKGAAMTFFAFTC
jgi:amino acid permease